MNKFKYVLLPVFSSFLFACVEDSQGPTIEEPKSVKVEFKATGDYEQFDALVGFTLTKGKTTLIYVEPVVEPDSLIFEYPIAGNFVNASLNFEPLTESFTVQSSEKVDIFTFIMISTSKLEGDENTNYNFTGEFRVFVDGELVKTIEHIQGQNEFSKTTQYTTEF